MRQAITTLFLSLIAIFSLNAQFNCDQAIPISCGESINDDNINNCQNTISGGYCGSGDFKYSGREKLYKFEITNQEQTVRIRLSGLSADLDMFLLRSCTPQDCISKSTGPSSQTYELISTSLSPGTYYIAIDGWGGASSSYNLELECVPYAGELDCATAISLSCGESVNGHTSNAANNNDGPYCNQHCNYSGPEQIFEFTLDVKSEVTITASELSADVDMFLLSSCDRKSCIGLSGRGGSNSEKIAKVLDPGTYFIVLDGYQDAVSSYKMTLDCVPLEVIDCNSAITTYYSGDGTNLKFAYIFNGGVNTEFIAWKLGNTIISNYSGVNFVFTNPGTYNICAEFKNLLTGEIETCCKTTCVSLPTQCEELIDYQYVDGHFELTLNSSNYDPTSVVWRNDTDGIEIDPNNIPASCRTLLVSVRYFDTESNCYIMCCKNIYFCPPTSCQDLISATFDVSSRTYTFDFDKTSAGQLIWKFDDTGEIIENGIYVLPNDAQCVDRPVTVYYFDSNTNCWKVCCKNIRLCPPQECEGAINYEFDSSVNGFQFSLDVEDATNETWRFVENNLSLVNGTFILPTDWTCQVLTVEASYFDPGSQCWRICTRVVDICPPTDCEETIDFSFNSETNSFEFTLNVPGASNLYWRFDEDNRHLPDGQFKLPAGWQCQERTVTVFYYDERSQCWRVCCKSINICPPSECETAIDYSFDSDDNSFQFTLNLEDASQLFWYFEEDGTVLPEGKFTLPFDWTCSNQWVNVYYYDSSTECWNLCSKKVTLCPPTDCEDAINYEYNFFTNSFVFSLDIPGATETVWKFDDDSGVIQNGIFPIPDDWTCMNKSISVYYFDPSIECWKLCSKNISICPPNNCASNIQYEYISEENAFQFNLDIASATDTYWKFDEGSNSIPDGKFTIPDDWQCQDMNIIVYYFNTETDCWSICSKPVTICPPTDCAENITYTYFDEGNKFVFDLNIAGASEELWKFDDTKEVLQNGEFVIPIDWSCKPRTVTAYYFDAASESWKSCCRSIYICPPSGCQDAITYSYDGSGNNVIFHFEGDPGMSSFSWTIQESGEYLGNNPTSSSSLAIPDPCKEVTVSIRYEIDEVWYYCHKRIFLCNPNECHGLISHEITNNILSLSLSEMYDDVNWFDKEGNLLGSGNEINYNIPNSEGVFPVTVIFKDESTNCYRTCNKDIEITCSLPEARFTYTPAGSGVYFSNHSNNANSITWNFGGGTLVEGNETSENPVVVFPTGTYNVCIEAVNSCGAKLFCEQITVDNNSTCTFDIEDNVCGREGETVVVPVRVTNFKDVLTFNFTIQSSNDVKCKILGLNVIDPTIANGSNYFLEADHVRFFWSSTSGKNIDDNAAIFNIEVELLEETDDNIILEFTNDPVVSEAFNSDMELIPLNLEQGSICVEALPLYASIHGQVRRPEFSDPISGTVVNALGLNESNDASGDDGIYHIPRLNVGANYTLRPSKNDNPFNGINALDIVLLQRHILQVNLLDSPFKYIAADVNNDRIINALDVVIMQRMQLRIISEFPNNESWRFVPTDYTFLNQNPLIEDFPEEREIEPLLDDMENEDFYGIKVGDLNYSAGISQKDLSTGQSKRNTGDTLFMNLGSVYSESNELVRIPVTVSNFANIAALEGTLSWDDKKLLLHSITDYGITSLTADNFGRPEGQDNILTFNWTDASLDGTSLEDNSLLFYLNFQPMGESGEQTTVRFTNTPLPLFSANSSLESLEIQSTKADIAFISPMIVSESHENNLCNGLSEGSISLNTSGGTGNFAFQWSNGETSSEITGLDTGTYSCTITDLYSHAEHIMDVLITSPDALEMILTTDSVSYASVQVLGGVPPYTYEWSNGEYTSVISDLEPGNYQVTVTDKNDCVSRSEVDIVNPTSTSTVEINNNPVTISPNPAKASFTIRFTNTIREASKYFIYSATGHLVRKGEIEKGVDLLEVNSAEMDAGLYYVKINHESPVVMPILVVR